MAREKIYKNLPNHVVIIPDGNRRWAKKHGLAPIEGHRKGLEAAENWSRPTLEVKYLMRLYASFFKVHLKELIKEGVRFNWLGRRDRVPKVLRQILEKIEAQTAKNSKYVLNIAIDYGGHEEIIAAFKKILKKGVKPSAINEKLVSENLETADLPDPDLLIRTSGEKRTSGIMPCLH